MPATPAAEHRDAWIGRNVKHVEGSAHRLIEAAAERLAVEKFGVRKGSGEYVGGGAYSTVWLYEVDPAAERSMDEADRAGVVAGLRTIADGRARIALKRQVHEYTNLPELQAGANREHQLNAIAATDAAYRYVCDEANTHRTLWAQEGAYEHGIAEPFLGVKSTPVTVPAQPVGAGERHFIIHMTALRRYDQARRRN